MPVAESLTGGEVMHLAIEPASTIVKEGVLMTEITAKVTISMTDLKLENDKITGIYDTHVDASETPFLFKKAVRKKAEQGHIELYGNPSLSAFKERGATFKGKGVCSEREDAERKIICKLYPDPDNYLCGDVLLEVDSGKRVMTFNTRYRVVDKTIVAERGASQLASTN